MPSMAANKILLDHLYLVLPEVATAGRGIGSQSFLPFNTLLLD